MNKPSQFVFLPTDKSSRIHLWGNTLLDTKEMTSDKENTIPQHLYILSDDEIREGDWVFDLVCKTLWKAKNQQSNTKGFKKIIATTNPELWHKEPISVYDPNYDGKLFGVIGVDKISQSDIEYIISLCNAKGKEVDVEKLALQKYPIRMEGNEEFRDDANRELRQGYKQCLQDNADKKFTLEDMLKAIRYTKDLEYMDGSKAQHLFTPQDILTKMPITKEQPKSDTVVVEYELDSKRMDNEKERYIPNIDFYQPKLKDGNICIVR